MDNETWLRKLKQTLYDRGLIKNGICEVCGELNPCNLERFYEKHHIHTKAFSEGTSVMCWNCHKYVTHVQNGVLPEFRKRHLPPKDRELFIFLSHAALRQRMAEVERRLMQDMMDGLKDK